MPIRFVMPGIFIIVLINNIITTQQYIAYLSGIKWTNFSPITIPNTSIAPKSIATVKILPLTYEELYKPK